MRNKTKNQTFYRHPRTTQERRANGKRSKWGRARRSQANLVDTYDDLCACVQKTWKVKRRHQYHEGGRGQQHIIFLPDRDCPNWRFWVDTWKLKEWFNNHDIPFHLEEVTETRVRVRTHQRVRKVIGWEPYTRTWANRPYDSGAKKIKTHHVSEIEWRAVYGWVTVKLAKPRIRRWSKRMGYNATWWSDKDIGVDHILSRCVVAP